MDTENLPEIFLSEKDISYKITRFVKQGTVRKIAGKIYTSNVRDDLEKIVSRRLWEIVGLLFPKAIIADRTAFDLKPTAHKEIFVISGKQRSVTVGEYTIYPRSGAPVQESDTPFMENLYLPSTARKFLESMRISRRKKSIENRYLSQTELEEKLDAFIRINGEDGIN